MIALLFFRPNQALLISTLKIKYISLMFLIPICLKRNLIEKYLDVKLLLRV